jgi:hypothetical protein
MGTIRVTTDTSTQSLREKLSSFETLSAVDAKTGRDGVVVLYEVKLGDRIKRFFNELTSGKSDHATQSRAALLKLANQRPEIATILQKYIFHKMDGWTTSELKEALNTPVTFLKQGKSGRGLEINDLRPGQVGVANSKPVKIEADCRIVWKDHVSEADIETQETGSAPDKGSRVIAARRPVEHNEKALLAAYKEVLRKANGHVVITPIADIGYESGSRPERRDGSVKAMTCSDENLKVLLQAIDEVKQEQSANPEISVTIAVGDYADKSLPQRIVDIEARREAEIQAGLNTQNQKQVLEARKLMPEILNRFVSERASLRFNQIEDVELEKTTLKTPLNNVHINSCSPALVGADYTFVPAQVLSDLTANLRQGKTGIQLREIMDEASTKLHYEHREAKFISDTKGRIGLSLLEMPPGELTSSRLFVMTTHGSSKIPAEDRQESRKFFLQYLEGVGGRVEVCLTGNLEIDLGLWDALKEISEKPPEGSQFILTSNLLSSDPASGSEASYAHLFAGHISAQENLVN